ncbi:MAG: 3'-5' exoribonuclease YhaM [Caldibacillus sp.]
MKNGIRSYAVGDQVEQFLLIKSSTKGVASNGKPFLSLVLQDKTGEIEAKLWDVSPEQEKIYTAPTIIKVLGDIQNYRGKLQLRIKRIRPANSQDNVQIEDFLEKAPVSVEKMQEIVTEYIYAINNPKLQRITRYLLKKYEKQFFMYPAATTNHHEFVSGLAYHVVSMLRLAEKICELYPSLNKDLLYAGIILHDLGKVHELSGPVATSYTVEGTLLGHITMMVDEIGKAAQELGIDGEEITLLKHIILSHHGKAEWGSPKPPLVMEAEVLHYIDNLDAKINMMERALENTKPGQFTERIFALDNRSLYKPTI